MVHAGVIGIRPFSWGFNRAQGDDDGQKGLRTMDNERHFLKQNPPSQIFQTISTGKIRISAGKCRSCEQGQIAMMTGSWRISPLFPASDSRLATVQLERTGSIFSSELPMGSAALSESHVFQLTISDELNPIQRSSNISFTGLLRSFQAVRATEPDPGTINFAGSDAFDGNAIIASSEDFSATNSQDSSHGFRESLIISSKQFEWSLAFLIS
jgi:hypothetical protein